MAHCRAATINLDSSPHATFMDTLPLTLVIFGASGDLTARKLLPSLYRLAKKDRLPQEARVIGVARSPFSDQAFREKMAAAIKEHARDDWDEATWARFAPRLGYAPGDAGTADGLLNLKRRLDELEHGQAGRRLFYLSVAPDLYPQIATRLGEVGLATENGPAWRRLIIEKPFGHDLATARALNETVRQHFHESQIYRIDHYLGKETVQNLLVFRFANILFEPIWNRNYIDHVQINVSETVTVGSRGGYYDRSGVLRDMFQNHLLQVLTLVAMEPPSRYSADLLRNEKVKVLDAVPICTAGEACNRIVTGQYAGYRNEKGVAPDSDTPTWAAVELHIDNWRWRHVPFYLRSGKGLERRRSEVVIQFRSPPHLMFDLPQGATLERNRLLLELQPNEGIHLSFQTKVPDESDTVLRPAAMQFDYDEAYPDRPLPEAYERLLQDAIEGDAALFMRSDEIERAWEIIDPLIAAAPIPQEYAVGSAGPACAGAFLARSGRSWVTPDRR